MRVPAGALGAVVACVVVGGVLGYAVGGSSATRPSAGFSARPMSTSPRLPVQRPRPYAPDNAMPPLPVRLHYVRARVGLPTQQWSVSVPRGWTREGGQGPGTVLWKPPNDLPGGYQVRIEPLLGRDSVHDKMAWQTANMPAGTTIENSTPTTIWFDYRDQDSNLHRFDFFTWVAVPGTDFAGLEISVAGREADVDGLNALMQHVRSSATPYVGPRGGAAPSSPASTPTAPSAAGSPSADVSG